MQSYIDLQKIADELDFDLEDVGMLFEAFLESAYEMLALMQKALEEGDMESLYRAAHALKGSAANLKLEVVENMAKEIELDVRANKKSDYSIRYVHLKSQIEALGTL